MESEWKNVEELNSRSYKCGYCGESITSNKGYYLTNYNHSYRTPSGEAYIYICHNCNCPTYFDYHNQVPGCLYGLTFSKEIFSDEGTYELYEEIRNCYKAKAYTSCVMSGRKLLMHIAVDCGAATDKSFKYYVDYLDENNYIPKNCKLWVDIIREKANETNHDIIIFEKKDAKQIINFLEILINVIYSMQYQANMYLA